MIVNADDVWELLKRMAVLPEATQAGALVFDVPNVTVHDVAPGPGIISPLMSVAPADMVAPLPQAETTGDG